MQTARHFYTVDNLILHGLVSDDNFAVDETIFF